MLGSLEEGHKRILVVKKKLTTPSKRGQKLIRRPAVSRCVSPWSSSLRGEVTCLLALIFTLDREHVVMRARDLALLVSPRAFFVSAILTW